MVNSGTVAHDSQSFEQIPSKYMSQLDGLSSSWSGSSHDNLIKLASEFHSEIQKITNQINSFASAAGLYERYKELKEEYNSCLYALHSQSDESDENTSASTNSSTLAEIKSQMDKIAEQIKAFLSDVLGFDLNGSESNGDTIDTEAALSAAGSATQGEFVLGSSSEIVGYITSSIDGRTYTVFNQNEIEGWKKDCNRAAAASIASAYATSPEEAVEIAKQSEDGIGYKSEVTNAYFSNFGLTANITSVQGKYDTVVDSIIENLNAGNCVMFDLSRPNVVGQSGQRWSYRRHWLSILDIRKTGEGDNDYAIFVSDSAHRGSSTDHGLGTGWYSIDEFTGKKIANFTVVSRTTQE